MPDPAVVTDDYPAEYMHGTNMPPPTEEKPEVVPEIEKSKPFDWTQIKDLVQNWLKAHPWIAGGAVGGALLGAGSGLGRQHGYGSMLGRGLLGGVAGAGLGYGIPKLIELIRSRFGSGAPDAGASE